MQRALSAAATGMAAQELKLSIIANNLSNVNTAGFKKSRAEFQDLLYDTIRQAGAAAIDGSQIPTSLQVGQGVRSVATMRQFTMGDLKHTGNVLDVAIEGPGFLQVTLPSGQTAYTRDGALKTDAQGRLVNADGHVVDPLIVVPPNVQDIQITADGTVSVLQGDSPTPIEIGRLNLANFINPAGLNAVGHNLYMSTVASGDPIVNQPGSLGFGTISQGFLEMSNVKAVDEMVDLIATQRAYEMGTRVIEAADKMLGSTSNIRG